MRDPLQPSRSLHQPPNPEDLRRFPPGGATCARVRGLMRDFVDGELEAEAATAVEEHVHDCRTCNLALARAEHELLIVTSAFPRLETAVPPGFASAVTARLMQEDRDLADECPDESLGGHASSRSGARRSAAGRVAAAARFLVSMPGSLMLSVMLLAGLVLVQSFAGAGDDAYPERVARLVITGAVDTHGLFGDRRLRLSSGDGVGDDQLVWVGAGGAAQADWHDNSEGRQPAARFQLGGNAVVRLHDGEPVLVNGKLQVEARRPFSFAVADGSRLELGEGEYLLSAESSSGDRWDPSAGAPSDLQVGVEVLHGDGARILRENAPSIFVGAGSIGLYSGGEVFVKTTTPPEGNARGEVPVPPASGPGTFRGVVWERNGLPAIGADVLISYRSAGLVHSTSRTVNASGIFTFDTGVPGAPPHCESPFAVLQVVPPMHRQELGLVPPDAYRLGRNGRHVHLHDSVVVDTSQVFTGQVVDDAGEPVLGVRMIPLVVDELFGCVLPWPEGQVATTDTGVFSISRLPARLPPHQHLAVVLMHPALAPTVVTVPRRGSSVANEFWGRIESPRLRSVRLHSMPIEATVQVWQDIEGLPAGSAARLYTAQTDEFGIVESLMVAERGRLYMRRVDSPQQTLRELRLDGPNGPPSYYPALGASQQFRDVFETSQVLPGTSLALAGTFRHQHIHTTNPAQARLEIYMTEALTGGNVPAAQVFALQPGGPRGRARTRFLGFTSMGGSLSYDIHSHDLGILAIAPNGATAEVELGDLLGQQGWIHVDSPGRVLIDSTLRPPVGAAQRVVSVRFEPVTAMSGLKPVMRRFASDSTSWEVGELPPGDYRATIGDQTFLVTVVAGGVSVLH